jgi:hypothetical protein
MFVAVDMRDSSTFTKRSLLCFTFSPTKSSALKTKYTIKVTLTDRNPRPRSSIYYLTVYIKLAGAATPATPAKTPADTKPDATSPTPSNSTGAATTESNNSTSNSTASDIID